MHRVWSKILDTDVFPECLDERTIHLLHVRMPAHSAHDVFYIEQQLQLSTIFPTARNERVRSCLLARIQSCERVLTFKSFHADMVLLDACQSPLRQLWPGDEGTLRQACRSSFQDEGGAFDVRYLDIWLYSIRHRPQFSCLRDDGLKRVGEKTTSRLPEAAIAELATFAASRGFRSEMIEVMRTGEPYGEQDVIDEVPVLSGAHHEVRLQDRCGRPSKVLFDSCWGNLSRKSILTEWNGPPDRHATPFAVARSFVKCLFELEQPYKAQKTSTMYNDRRIAPVNRPSSPILNRPGRSSTLLAPINDISQLRCAIDTDNPSWIGKPDALHFGDPKLAAAYQMSTSSHQSHAIKSGTSGGVKTLDKRDRIPFAYGRKRWSNHIKTTGTMSTKVTKHRQQASNIVRPKGQGLRDLHLVELHCPGSERTKIDSD
jgi:hypothetical protein